MPTYVTLAKWTDEGVKGVKDLPQRLAGAREAARAAGGDIKGVYMLMGEYDVLLILEAPDDKTMATSILRQAGLGNVRTTTVRAFTEEEIGEIAAGL